MPASTPDDAPYQPSASDVASFEADGFLVTPPLFDAATLAGARAEIERCWAEETARIGRDVSHAGRGRAAYSAVRPELPRLHLRSPALARLCRSPALVRLAGALLGPDVDLSWNQAYTKAPHGDPRTAIPWHQDGYYAPIDGGTFNCWLAISETTVENGTIERAPRPAGDEFLPHAWDETLLFYACAIDESTATAVALAPGQAFVFGGRVPHRSGANRSAQTRVAYSISFTQAGARLRANGETFGDRVPVLRGGVPVETLLRAYVAAGEPADHPAAALLAELDARAPRRRDEWVAWCAALRDAVRVGDDEAFERAVVPLLSLLPESGEANGDLARARARTDQLEDELARLRRTDAAGARTLARRILELAPDHALARAVLGDGAAPPRQRGT